MRTFHFVRCLGLIATFALTTADARAQACIEVVDDGGAPNVARPEVDVKQVVRLDSSTRALMDRNKTAFVYVRIVREAGTDHIDGKQVSHRSETFIRMLRGPNWATPFTFSREGKHTLDGFVGAADTDYEWPASPTDPMTLPKLCNGATTSVTVDPPKQREDFPGVRGQWWTAYRLPARVEFGSALFVKRIGVAASGELAILRAIKRRDDPLRINPWTSSFEIRYRGSRGYLGGGARYYPDAELDREHWRPGFFAGEELPSFKGRRLWLLTDVTLEEKRKNVIKALRLTFGIRMDLWGSQP